ncbi:LPXTG cell wall anchor domain-containing protein [Enterococcus durans]|uniref:LPXTG cell wall anchor domain-containing protein n=1 Tax=Enterococcus durans TaxID=53345 RepID=UPI00136177A4|nr:LPXTG cell wall anchor domain-containing protein [Enterococcus durans]MZH23541.1 LPXTG cell wall anchor domain-containing protein [Enterococcus durans]MZI10179.1 LPXTG cell wall anchor domain-containing protein [Enterococcus durans]MZI17356.1 LPXTG cell wall anchor domain-containing protein [Enterococcus durans]NAA24222.1 LPXTG cell wall anchor domain-containing protein [Enterococcus durans]NAA70583.1 LPXTG cell wall anchor domain-containing protein [Enterococcus durans]
MVKNKSGSIIAIVALFLNLLVSIPVVAETYLPQDPGTIHEDLTGNYGALGIASQFHVFSKGKTTINAHTNGNIATKELDANNNFGTDIISGDLQLEINYVQMTDSLIGSSLTSGNDNRVNKFVVGETVTTGAENDKAVINGSRIDHLTLEEFYQDRPGQTYIDFASEFAQLVSSSDLLMSMTPTQTFTSADFPDMNNRTMVLTGTDDSNFILANVDASVLQGNTPLNISNPENKVVVLNVINAPADFTVQSQIHYNGRNNQETEDFSDANLSWNFGSSLPNLTIAAPFQGTIIAPNTDITVNQNMDGTIIGNNVVLNASTNRWDPNEIFPVDIPDHSDSSSTTEPSTSDSTSESTTEPSTSESSTTEPSTSDSTSESTTEPSTSDSTSESTSESSTSDSTSSTTEPSTSDSTSSTTEPSTSESTSESTTEPSTSESTSESTTEPSTSDSTSESTTEPSTSDSTSSTTEPSTSESTSESTTEPSTPDSTSNTTEPSTSDSTSESTPETPETPGTPGTSGSTMHRHSNGGSVPMIAGQDSSTSNTATEILAASGSNNTGSMDQIQNNNDDSTTLPKTNSTSNRWLAAVGIVVIIAVSGYLIYRRKKF